MIESGLIYRWLTAHHLGPGARLPALQVLARLCGCSFHRARQEVLALEAAGVLLRRSPRSFLVRTALATTDRDPVPDSIRNQVVVLAERVFDRPGWTNPSLTRLFQAFTRTAGELGLEPMVLTPDEAGVRRVVQLARACPAGWVVTQMIRQDGIRDRLFSSLCGQDQPVVVHGDSLPPDQLDTLPWDRVLADHRAGAKALVLHLAALGCRRLLPVTALGYRRRHLSFPNCWWYQERHAGYASGCAEAGIALLSPRPWLAEMTQKEEPAFDEAVLAMRGVVAAALDGSEPPDGLLALEDGQALVLGAVGRALGRPLPVAGFDASWRERPEAAWGMPPTVTWDQDRSATGTALATTLVARRQNPAAPRRTVLVPGRLVVPN